MPVHATTKYDLTPYAKPTEGGYDIVKFPSDSRPGKFYTVDITQGRCDCPAWIFSKKRSNGLRPICKHLERLGFTEIGNEVEPAEPKKVGGQKVKVHA